jgi:hypothetical protein
MTGGAEEAVAAEAEESGEGIGRIIRRGNRPVNLLTPESLPSPFATDAPCGGHSEALTGVRLQIEERTDEDE